MEEIVSAIKEDVFHAYLFNKFLEYHVALQYSVHKL